MFGFDLVRASRHASRGLFHALASLGDARLSPPADAREAVHRLAGALGTIARAHELAVTVRGDVRRHEAQHGFDRGKKLPYPAALAAVAGPANGEFAIRTRYELS